jgi:hypothetical protein
VRVPNTFRPGTQVQVILSWRNAQQVDVSLVPVRLIDVINPPATAEGDWIGTLQPRKGEPLRRQQLTAPEARPYYAVTRVARFDESLPAGAYVVVARAGDLEKRSLLLVTESALVLKATSTQALLYACSSVTGAPIAGATLVLWTRPADSDGAWSAHPASTGSEGMVLLDLAAAAGGPMERDIVAAMYSGEQQAYVTHFPGSGEAVATEDRWNFAVFPDKSVYRLGEEIRWLVVARKDVPQATSRMPDGEELRFRLLGPDDYELSSGTLRTNAYGTAWSSVSLPRPRLRTVRTARARPSRNPPCPWGITASNCSDPTMASRSTRPTSAVSNRSCHRTTASRFRATWATTAPRSAWARQCAAPCRWNTPTAAWPRTCLCSSPSTGGSTMPTRT